ncbi:hypothetical protein ABL78_8058 [Leptomonas seymouri]|uniref:PPPDE domain-containing protein n=1 Tax=Leptomonas seymouri TaxID=5684 RepID=A0A0N1P9Q0_LEPSE|nr:hypothetical protein ABL78_8058 [Leptomonas seymouri]|eukprot:KPI82925.1 hypothetical protein ABL78_8058 [Leptomonas seymouri]
MTFCCCGVGATSSVTSKNANQLRHLERMGLTRGRSPRLHRTEVQIPVTLNVYSLLESNKKLSKMGMGVYHTGVVVYGIEWGYGEVVENPNASGLFCVHPGQAAGTLYRTIRIGYTTRSPMQVDTILHRLENEWRSSEYHILHHNCNHFAQAFCDLLSTTEKLQVPAWCNRAARVGDRIIPRKLATKVQHMMDDEPPKAVAPSPFCNINEVPLSVVPREWYLHPSIFQPMRYVDDSRPGSLQTRESLPAAAASNEGNDGGGSSHYTVEYDILPPPGYESASAGSTYPPLMQREVYLLTDEKGSITHMTAIEEQPSVTRTSRAAPSCRSSWSRRAAKLTPGDNPLPPPRARAPANHPLSVAPTGSPQGSTLNTETESALQSNGSNEFPPLSAFQLEALAPRRPSSTTLGAADDGSPLGNEAGNAVSKRNSNANHEESSSERPYFTAREASMRSASLTTSMISYGGGHGELKTPLFGHPRQAQPIGCISALPSAPATPVTVGAARRREQAAEERHSGATSDAHSITTAATTSSTSTSSESSLTTSTAVDSRKHKDENGTITQRRKKANSSHHSSSKGFNDFSNIVTLPNALSTELPKSADTAVDSKKNPAWAFLLKARNMGSANVGTKKGKKYLSTSQNSDAASHTEGDNNLDLVSEVGPFPISLENLLVQPQQSQRHPQQQQQQRQQSFSTAAVMVAESVSDTRFDGMRSAQETTVMYMPDSSSSVSLRPGSAASSHEEGALLMSSIVQDGVDAPTNANDMPIKHVEGERRHGVSAPSSPRHQYLLSSPSSTKELHPQPLPRCFSGSAIATGSTTAGRLQSSDSVSLRDTLPQLPNVPELNDNPTQQSQAFAVTPERAVVSATMDDTSSTTANLQTRCGSMSTLSDMYTPSPQQQPAERTRTPIPSPHRRLARHSERASITPLLNLNGGDAMEPLMPRSSNLSSPSLSSAFVAPRRSASFGGGEVGMQQSPEKVAHTPMAPFPRRPSLLSRGRSFAASMTTSPSTHAHGRSACMAQRNLALELRGTPPKSATSTGSRGTLDEG